MLGMLKRHEIQVLLKAGHSRAEVAELTGVSIRSVNWRAAGTIAGTVSLRNQIQSDNLGL